MTTNFKSIFVLIPACLLAAGCSTESAPQQRTEVQLEARSANVAPAKQLAVEETVFATGSLAAHDRAELSAKVSGRVEAILVDLGSRVKQGDLLAQIEKRDFELKVQQAEASLAQAQARVGLSLTGKDGEPNPEDTSVVKEAQAVLAEATKNRDRIVSLVEQGVLPESDAETAISQFQVASSRYDEAMQEALNRMATLKLREAELALAQQQLTDAEIRAPFDGVVERRQTSPGEFLSVGGPILTVVRVDPIRMRLEVAEKDAPRVALGQKVYLQIEGSGQTHEGSISRLSPIITADNRMLLAEADFANPEGNLRPGSFAKANIVVNPSSNGLFVPRAAIVSFAGLQKLFVAREGKAAEVQVRLGREKDGWVEVEGEVKPGELIVISPGNLRDSQPLNVARSET